MKADGTDAARRLPRPRPAGHNGGMRASAAGLPIDDYVAQIRAALRGGGRLALSAETGAGKTTALMARLAESREIQGRVLVLEPRRLAAVSSAARAAELLGGRPGGAVGYRVRGDAKPGSRLEYCTEAVFMRVVQDDPFLEGVGLVVFDEFHERSAIGDLCLAFARFAAEARPELGLLVMSATLDGDGAAAYLGSPSLSVPGRLYPVELRYRPAGNYAGAPWSGPAGYLGGGARRWEGAGTVAAAAREAWDAVEGDLLVFLPGLREIGDAREATALAIPQAEILMLHGGMELREQSAVIASPVAGRARRVILATSVAETSLTVPGIAAVVDMGLSRFTRYDGRSGLNRLVTERVSLAEAEQRAGRAGRLGPGLCIRCWDRGDILRPAREPEIMRTELSAAALECALRGEAKRSAVDWLDEPPAAAWDDALELLAELGFLEGAGATPLGARAARLGTGPRAAAALLAAEGAALAERSALALACALLEERVASLRSAASLTEAVESSGGPETRPAVAEAERLFARAYGPGFSLAGAKAAADRAGELMAPGFPDRLARRAEDGSWELRSGKKAKHGPGLPESGWILALDCDAGAGLGTIYRSAPVSEGAALAALGRSARSEETFSWKGLSPRIRSRRLAGRFVIKEGSSRQPTRDELEAAALRRLQAEGSSWLPWDEEALAVVARVRYAHRAGALRLAKPELWAEATPGPLLSGPASPLLPYLDASGGPILDAAALRLALADALDDENLGAGPGSSRLLDREAPAFIVSPGGRRRRIAYPEAGEASLALRIQEAFGLLDSPIVCGRPLVLELLSPADRPLQRSADLRSFWGGAYRELRAGLQSRYPKHYWPEDPLKAEPGRGLKPRP